MLNVHSAQRRASSLSSITGTMSPAYPTCFTGTAFTAVVMISAAVIVPLEPKRAPVYDSIAAPMETSPRGAGGAHQAVDRAREGGRVHRPEGGCLDALDLHGRGSDASAPRRCLHRRRDRVVHRCPFWLERHDDRRTDHHHRREGRAGEAGWIRGAHGPGDGGQAARAPLGGGDVQHRFAAGLLRRVWHWPGHDSPAR